MVGFEEVHRNSETTMYTEVSSLFSGKVDTQHELIKAIHDSMDHSNNTIHISNFLKQIGYSDTFPIYVSKNFSKGGFSNAELFSDWMRNIFDLYETYAKKMSPSSYTDEEKRSYFNVEVGAIVKDSKYSHHSGGIIFKNGFHYTAVDRNTINKLSNLTTDDVTYSGGDLYIKNFRIATHIDHFM